MFALANLVYALTHILNFGLNIYMWVVIGRAIISWVNPDPYNPIVRFLYQATEPVLGRIRNVLPYMGGIDLSPIAVILAIVFAKKFLIQTLFDIAFKLKTGG